MDSSLPFLVVAVCGLSLLLVTLATSALVGGLRHRAGRQLVQDLRTVAAPTRAGAGRPGRARWAPRA